MSESHEPLIEDDGTKKERLFLIRKTLSEIINCLDRSTGKRLGFSILLTEHASDELIRRAGEIADNDIFWQEEVRPKDLITFRPQINTAAELQQRIKDLIDEYKQLR